MLFDKKKAAQTILSHIKEPEKHIESPSEMVDHDFAGLHAASEDLVNAIHNKSPMDVHKALRSYLDLHKQLEPGESPDNESSENEKGSKAGHQYGMQAGPSFKK